MMDIARRNPPSNESVNNSDVKAQQRNIFIPFKATHLFQQPFLMPTFLRNNNLAIESFSLL